MVPHRVRLICSLVPVGTSGIPRMLGLMCSMCGGVRVSVCRSIKSLTRVFVVCWVTSKVVQDVLCSSYWGLWRVLPNESGAPSLDHFVEVTGSVHCRSSELADRFPYVVFLCFPKFP